MRNLRKKAFAPASDTKFYPILTDKHQKIKKAL